MNNYITDIIDTTKLQKIKASAMIWCNLLGLGQKGSAPTSQDNSNERTSSLEVHQPSHAGLTSTAQGVDTLDLIPKFIEFLRLCWDSPPDQSDQTEKNVRGRRKGSAISDESGT